MPLINVNADLKEAGVQLKRIADCLVEILRTQGVHLEPVEADLSTAKDIEEISYSTDAETAKQILIDLHDGRNPFRAVDVEEN